MHTETFLVNPPTNFLSGSVKALDYSLADIRLIKKGLIFNLKFNLKKQNKTLWSLCCVTTGSGWKYGLKRILLEKFSFSTAFEFFVLQILKLKLTQ